ncbi:MAG: hypothetical protein JW929_08140 [Anaerolineales bacterium]|nr:hypothetical protein [Anaerolineales bacterium]
MPMRPRILLAVLGIAVVCVSCAAILYAFWPLSSVREQIVIFSNLFGLP